MKKYLTNLAVIIIVVLLSNYLYYYSGVLYMPKFTNESVSWIENKEFVIKDENDDIKKIKVRGVNLGLGIPGHFATERAIDKERYLDWIKKIKDMGANTIRIYTLAGDDFYDALYEYNSTHKEDPIYIIHGVWLDDNIHMSNVDAYDKRFGENIIKNAKNVIDAIHGRLKLKSIEDSGKQRYSKDVSRWVIGYIFGVEWEYDTVIYTNKINVGMQQYDGKYIYTEDASPFEIFLAKTVDKIISYESQKYGQHRNFALSNWPTTDPLEYDESERLLNGKYAEVDVENIKVTDKFKSNQFASYHIYPYYPEFEYKGDNNINLYKDYLTKICNHHSIPVIISEFGVPSSRGRASYEQNRKFGRDQGNLTEKEQGKAVINMYKDIMESGAAGAIVFIWQDEWFKRTWNTMANIDLSNTAYWSDYQTNEQYFGLLSFDPGEKESVCYPDGDKSEWSKKNIIRKDSNYNISYKYDEKYLYFMVDTKGKNIKKEKLFIPIDTTQKTGSKEIGKMKVKTDRYVDFVITLDGEKNSKILVQDRYDNVETMHSKNLYKYFNAYSNPPKKDSSNFKIIRNVLFEGDYYFRDKKVDINSYIKGLYEDAARSYVLSQVDYTGNLLHGNGNPKSEHFNNLADFCYGNDFVEIRIPWQLLNFYNPSEMEIHDDYYECYGVEPLKIDKIYAGVGKSSEEIKLAPMELKGWGKKVTYHERLKESYYILKDYWNKEELN